MKSVNSLRESFKLQRTGLPNPQTWQWYIIVEELRVPQQQQQLNGKKFIGHCSAETSGLGEGEGVGDRKLPEREGPNGGDYCFLGICPAFAAVSVAQTVNLLSPLLTCRRQHKKSAFNFGHGDCKSR